MIHRVTIGHLVYQIDCFRSIFFLVKRKYIITIATICIRATETRNVFHESLFNSDMNRHS